MTFEISANEVDRHVDLAGRVITVRSDGPHRGSTFQIELPLYRDNRLTARLPR
jgi:hypothetical protein